jgi:hypothetical protein
MTRGAAAVLGGLLICAPAVYADVVGDDTEVWVPQEAPAVDDVVEVDCPEGPNLGRISFNIGADIPTMYFFRGILQEDRGFILQPYADATVNLYENEGNWFSGWDVYGGIWNSLHSEITGSTRSTGPEPWYEFDAWGGTSLTFWDVVELNTAFTTYNSPNGAFDTYHDILAGFGFDDSEWLGRWAIHPMFNFYFETQGNAFTERGGARPSPNFRGRLFQMVAGWDWPVLFQDYEAVIRLPIELGLNINNYYARRASDGGTEDPTYGYFQTGLSLDLPLSFVPSEYGAWLVDVGARWINVGDSLKSTNNGDSGAIYGKFGIAMAY